MGNGGAGVIFLRTAPLFAGLGASDTEQDLFDTQPNDLANVLPSALQATLIGRIKRRSGWIEVIFNVLTSLLEMVEDTCDHCCVVFINRSPGSGPARIS